jgi:RNA polymerase sigma-70 factor, ECF subfamily
MREINGAITESALYRSGSSRNGLASYSGFTAASAIKTIPHHLLRAVHSKVTRRGYLTICHEPLWRRIMEVGEFGKLLEEQIPRLRRYARALTRNASRADDLVQDCLYRAIRKRHLFQPGTDLRAWLFTLLHNQHVNLVRSGLREGIAVPVEDVEEKLGEPASQGSSLHIRDLDRAMARLPEGQRQVVLLVGLEGLQYEDVAKILDVPVGTVRSRLSRAREALRHSLGRELPRAAA